MANLKYVYSKFSFEALDNVGLCNLYSLLGEFRIQKILPNQILVIGFFTTAELEFKEGEERWVNVTFSSDGVTIKRS